MQFQDQAYLLHIKPYRESSALVRLLTQEHGLVGGVLKGVYKKDKRAAAYRASLQLGNALEIVCLGRSDLKSIIQADAVSVFPVLNNTRIFLCLSYANELLLRLLQEGLPCKKMFHRYQQLIASLSLVANDVHSPLLEASLRAYEFDLLDLLGFGLDFCVDAETHEEVKPAFFYRVISGVGVMKEKSSSAYAFDGEVLQNIQARDFSEQETRRQAKMLSRYLIEHCLDGPPLKTRKLYQDMMSLNC